MYIQLHGISAKLDYCNSLFIDIPDYLIAKLQRVQNAAARIVLKLKKYDSVTPHLIELHWTAYYLQSESHSV